MNSPSEGSAARPLARFPTGLPGLDAVLGGGLLAGDAYLVVGAPGTGKTTLGNHLAFAHAAVGGQAVVATLLTETHDRMLGHLQDFAFFDSSLTISHVRHLSLLSVLEDGGLDGLLDGLRAVIREQRATLLVLDGTAAVEDLAASGFAYGRFVRGLQARAAVLGCTTVLLASRLGQELNVPAIQVDGIVELALETVGARDVRWLRVVKLRGGTHLTGRHPFQITGQGVAVAPRLAAALADTVPLALTEDRVPFGVAALDAMLDGGLPARSTTMVLGTPGAGKTILGLHFLAAGAEQGEPGLIATFHEPAPALAATAAGIGLGLAPHLASGRVQVLWRAPLELAPDAWGWEVLRAVARHRPRRFVLDAFTELARLFGTVEQQVAFLTALANELRARDVTSLVTVELDAFAGPSLLPPIPAVSTAMDNGVLLRTAELHSRLVRVISILKTRQSAFDPAIRAFTISDQGLEIGDPLPAETGLLTGVGRAGAREQE
jgi:circadian clock protein KaiC